MSRTIGARLQQDGTLYVQEPLTADDGFDEVTQSTHKVTKTNVFANELDEVTLLTGSSSGGAILLDGSSQKINVAGSSDFQFGTGDFTMEGWFYLNDNTSYTRLWCFPNGDNIEVNNTALYYWNGGANVVSSGVSTVPIDVWFHVALVKHNGNVNVYINGKEKITDSNPYNSATSRSLTIGGENTGDSSSADSSSTAGWLNGYITNFRVIKGSAAYTSNFSVSYAPLGNITNTVLLLSVADAGHLLTDSSNKNQTVTSSGSPGYSSTTPLNTTYNGAMKQLKTGTLQVANEFNEITVLS